MAGVFKWWLAGQIQPAKGYQMACEDTEMIIILSNTSEFVFNVLFLT